MEQTKDKPGTVDRNDAWKNKQKLEPIKKEWETGILMRLTF